MNKPDVAANGPVRDALRYKYINKKKNFCFGRTT